jgi:hypothetical protein
VRNREVEQELNMADDEVKILSWPSQPAQLEHQFVGGAACPVQVGFNPTPANVVLSSTTQEPVHVDVNMNMNVVARNVIPICVELCKPICVQSDYTIAIEVFDRPVAQITFRGMSRIYNCDESK